MALYDSLQIYQMRAEYDQALAVGERAIQRLEQGGADKKQSLSYSYLLGRVYFRLGAIEAIGRNDHRAAVAWYGKAVPMLSRALPQEALADLGRHGETFVSMGVSYWETGEKDKAMDLTRRGVALMEQAVKNGSAEPTILTIPYGNLATMHKAMGQEGEAKQFAAMAARSKATVQK